MCCVSAAAAVALFASCHGDEDSARETRMMTRMTDVACAAANRRHLLSHLMKHSLTDDVI